MKVETKEEALAALKLLSEDITLLASGDWVPDDDSCMATLEVIEAVREYIKELK